MTTDFTASNTTDADHAEAVVVQPDGKIVVVGSAGEYWAVARYNANGSIDTTFDGDGKVTALYGSGTSSASGSVPYDVAVQADGKIVTGGWFLTMDGNSDGYGVLARYNPNGSPDTTFDDGHLTTRYGTPGAVRGDTMALQPDGKILLAGSFGSQFGVARFNPSGSVDVSFDEDGYLLGSWGAEAPSLEDLLVQRNGKVVVVGTYRSGDSTAGGLSYDFALARYDAYGRPDTTFSGDGKLVTDFGTTWDEARGAALGADGKLVVAGQSGNDIAVARYAGDPTSDRENPLVSFRDPYPNSHYGGQVLLTAEVNDNVGVDHVEFYVNNRLVGTDYTADSTGRYYSATWDSRSVGNGPVDLDYRAVDNSNNMETYRDIPIYIDNTAPTTELGSTPASLISQGSASFTWSGSDNMTLSASVQYRYKLYTGAWSSWWIWKQTGYANLADGQHTFQVQAQDEAGNVDATPATYTFRVDTTAPSSASLRINGSAAYTNRTAVTLSPYAQDAGSGVSEMRFASDAGAWSAWRPYAASTAWTLPAVDGLRKVRVQLRDTAGNASAEVSDTIGLDRIAPTSPSREAYALARPAQLGASSVPVRLSWPAVLDTSGSGLGGYALRQSVNGGAYTSIYKGTGRALTLSLAPGRSYKYCVSALDRAGNRSAERCASFSLSTYQETSTTVKYAGTWASASSSSYYGGAVKRSSTRSSTARLAFAGRQVEAVSTLGADRGKGQVSLYQGSTLVASATVDLYRPAGSTRQVIWGRSGLDPAKAYTLQVKVLGTKNALAKGTRIDVDGFAVVR